MPKDIRNHPYALEQELQRQAALRTVHDAQEPTKKPSTYFTWLVFMKNKWVPFDACNQAKLEQTLHLGGTFVDIEDTNFPKVKRVRVFPKSNYLSYLGVKYRLSRVMQPDAWVEAFEQPSAVPPQLHHQQQQQQQHQQQALLSSSPPIHDDFSDAPPTLQPPQQQHGYSYHQAHGQQQQQVPPAAPIPSETWSSSLPRRLPPPPPVSANASATAAVGASAQAPSYAPSNANGTDYWQKGSSRTLISHVLS